MKENAGIELGAACTPSRHTLYRTAAPGLELQIRLREYDLHLCCSHICFFADFPMKNALVSDREAIKNRSSYDSMVYMSLVMRKPAFCICENKDADQLRGDREADQRLCIRFLKVQYLYFLNTKFQASSHLLWLYSQVCVGPGRKPRRPVFSERGSYIPGICRIVWFEVFLKYTQSKILMICNMQQGD